MKYEKNTWTCHMSSRMCSCQVSSPTVWRLLTDSRMFTVPQLVVYVQTGVYAKGSKFKADCYDDVCITYASTSMYVLVYTQRKIKFPEGEVQDSEFGCFTDFTSTFYARENFSCCSS